MAYSRHSINVSYLTITLLLGCTVPSLAAAELKRGWEKLAITLLPPPKKKQYATFWGSLLFGFMCHLTLFQGWWWGSPALTFSSKAGENVTMNNKKHMLTTYYVLALPFKKNTCEQVAQVQEQSWEVCGHLQN